MSKARKTVLGVCVIHSIFVKVYVCGSRNSNLPFSYNDPLLAQGQQYHLFQMLISAKKGVIFKKLQNKWKFFMQQEIFNFCAQENLGECLGIMLKHIYICGILKTKLCKLLFLFVI